MVSIGGEIGKGGKRGRARVSAMVILPYACRAPDALVANVRRRRNAPSGTRSPASAAALRGAQRSPATIGSARRTRFDFAVGETYPWKPRAQCVSGLACL